jgi:hypothetical protein
MARFYIFRNKSTGGRRMERVFFKEFSKDFSVQCLVFDFLRKI